MLVELSVVGQRYLAVTEALDGARVTDVATRYGVDRRSVVEQRYLAVTEALDGARVTDVATRYGVDRRSVVEQRYLAVREALDGATLTLAELIKMHSRTREREWLQVAIRKPEAR
jgi:hypothetical protein